VYFYTVFVYRVNFLCLNIITLIVILIVLRRCFGLLKTDVKYYLFVFVKDIASRLKATVNDASNLLDIYYSVGSLVLIKVIIWFLLYSLCSESYVKHSCQFLLKSLGNIVV